MSLAADAREAVLERPFLLEALRAGVVNYRSAAEILDVGDPETVATALRRFAADLPVRETEGRDARVTMEMGVGRADDADDALLTVGGVPIAPDAGTQTAVIATGDVDARALQTVLARLDAADVGVDAAGVCGETLVVVAGTREGATALRVVEDALDAVPV